MPPRCGWRNGGRSNNEIARHLFQRRPRYPQRNVVWTPNLTPGDCSRDGYHPRVAFVPRLCGSICRPGADLPQHEFGERWETIGVRILFCREAHQADAQEVLDALGVGRSDENGHIRGPAWICANPKMDAGAVQQDTPGLCKGADASPVA